MYYIGIDLGTSSLKSILIDDKNTVIKSVSKKYPIYYPADGFTEQDPDDWWRATKESLVELLQDVDKSKLRAIGVAGQMHGLVALDEMGMVLRPAILWNDTRTKEETYYLNEEVGREVINKHTGNIAYAGFTLPKIMWLEKNEPEIYEKIAHILLPKDYIVYKLTGKFSIDYSDASGTLLLDVENKAWSEEMCEIGHVNKEWLPDLYESYEVVDQVKANIMDSLGLEGQVKVIAGAGDNAGAAVSVGAIDENTCNISLGTSGTIFIPTDNFVKDKNYGLHSFAHSSGRFHLMGCTLSAASSLEWWITNILQVEDFDAELAGSEEFLAANNVYYMPYLNGERSPHNDEYIRGGFVGLSATTTRKEMTLAILEGVAFSLRDCLECAHDLNIFPSSSTIVGGGAKSDLWCKIMANVLKFPIVRVEAENGPGLGAAIMARYACSEGASLSELSQIKTDQVIVFSPEEELVEKYELAYGKYKELYPSLKNFYRK